MPHLQPVPLKIALLNTPEIELWPAALLRACSNHDARALSRARRVLRRKRDGVYLAADLAEGLLPLVPGLQREPGLDAALDALETMPLQEVMRQEGGCMFSWDSVIDGCVVLMLGAGIIGPCLGRII